MVFLILVPSVIDERLQLGNFVTKSVIIKAVLNMHEILRNLPRINQTLKKEEGNAHVVLYFSAGTGCVSPQTLTATENEQYLTSPGFPGEYPLYEFIGFRRIDMFS